MQTNKSPLQENEKGDEEDAALLYDFESRQEEKSRELVVVSAAEVSCTLDTV